MTDARRDPRSCPGEVSACEIVSDQSAGDVVGGSWLAVVRDHGDVGGERAEADHADDP
jgi:hypothetical protein